MIRSLVVSLWAKTAILPMTSSADRKNFFGNPIFFSLFVQKAR